jgi:murein L,D-transpeptidase YafK
MILSLLLVAAFLLSFLPVSRYYVDRAERIARMGWHQLFYRSYRPIPTTPDLSRLKERLKDKGVKLGAPIFLRIFKREARLEIWMKQGDAFIKFASYPICYYSGRLGPKQKQGDRQAPEGFYTVSKGQLNPNSRWHRSFNLGYPNLFDRAHSRTGNYLMVHGGCSSIGCYAMTNEVIDEIWLLITKALANGQKRFHVHAYPFRMTKFNMLRYRGHKWQPFWLDLKKGYDLFEATHRPPHVSVCNKRYQVRNAKPGSPGNTPITRLCRPQSAGL